MHLNSELQGITSFVKGLNGEKIRRETLLRSSRRAEQFQSNVLSQFISHPRCEISFVSFCRRRVKLSHFNARAESEEKCQLSSGERKVAILKVLGMTVNLSDCR